MPDMPSEEFRRFGHEVVDWIADYLADPASRRVLPECAPGDLRRQLPAAAQEHGEEMQRILADFRDTIVPACTMWNHPGFHAYFSVSSSGPGILAESLIAALNTNGMVWKSSPATTELEQVVVDWLRQWLGLPQCFGLIFDTASQSTLHALLGARCKADPESRERGATANFVVYTSAQAHSSVEKAAMALGFGQRNVRKIAVDESFRMRPELLRAAIGEDRANGWKPLCVVATVGTTGTSSVDPVPQIADICEEHALWLHIDAAYGGFSALVPECAHLMNGCGRADSLVTNPHKWLFTPQDCSVLYTKHPEALRNALSLVPEYLRTGAGDAVNFMDYSIALGRRFRALKLWFIMRYFGREGVARILSEQVRMTQALARKIEADQRFELCAPVPLTLICFRRNGSDEDNQALLDRLNASGTAFFSHNIVNGRFMIRWAIGNIHTTEHHLSRLWEMIQHA
ncbi:MAG: aminotransferase class V-fold PLP-dependent enzyme [Candidatus Solibacter usitatus]|nr:aminotransferase class V-fold PLP-dependent enzyme [Candidatus Solibacter usitatus]